LIALTVIGDEYRMWNSRLLAVKNCIYNTFSKIPPSTSMHFATRVRTWRVARLYSKIALSRKPFGIGHMYIYTFLLRMTDTMTSQNIDLFSWDTLYNLHI
jgi:hypothetical protein